MIKKAGVMVGISTIMLMIVFGYKSHDKANLFISTRNVDMSDAVVVESEVVEVTEPEPMLDESEIDLLARLMTAEQGYNADEKVYSYTGSVVLNRVNDERFPNTIYDVIYAKGQYQCVTNGHINRPYDDVAWEVAEWLLSEGSILPNNVVFQAEFTQGRGVYDKIGRTYFCYY